MSNRYAELRLAARVRETTLFPLERAPSELELQARWFAGDFGRSFVSTAGDKIEMVQFGTWNREAGPDFSDAVIQVNGQEPARGSIEFDLTDHSWESHGHAANPAFENTVLHVFVNKSQREFFTRTKSHRNVPQVRVDLAALAEGFAANVPLARPGRCQAPLKTLSDDRLRSILDAAAQFRLQRKAARIRSKIDSHGRDEALFQELAAALGYKENKLPFALVSQRLPLKLLRANIVDVEALLFGVASFLEMRDLGSYASDARSYLRTLWDRWWLHRDGMERLILPPKTWKLSSTRPVNHPQRRLGALSTLVAQWTGLTRSLSTRNQKSVSDFLANLRHPFWNFHYTLNSEESQTEMALIGESRIAEILANVVYPLGLAESHDVWTDYSKLPARLSNRRLATAAARLFADDSRQREFLKTVAHQQGLLQIYEDFCMQDNSDCAQCPFPEQMRKWE